MNTRLGRPLTGQRVHFTGIGGAGMAALAELLLDMGYDVAGSDIKESRVTRRIAERGARVWVGQHHPEVVEGADHVVVSNAIGPRNPELMRARELGLDVVARAELLGRLFEAGRGVAVSGTHGKTTTSSMLARALDAAGLEPSYLVGGDLNEAGTGAHLGAGDLVVAEADEAFGSFLHLRSHLALVTNVDMDHHDFYSGQDSVDDAFVEFLQRRLPGGAAVLCADDPGVARIAGRVTGEVITYGTSAADLTVERNADGVRATWKGQPVGTLRLRVPGRHNVLNAGGALAAALSLGADAAPVLASLESFSGVDRRFSVRGEVNGIVVVDDYSHHPSEVAVALDAAREAYPGRRVIVLFQPHLYSRTQALAGDFGVAFGGADVVVVTDIDGSRELPVPGVSGRLVWDAARDHVRDLATYVPRLEEAAGFVAGLAEPGDVVLTMGAGDVTGSAPHILGLLRTLSPASGPDDG